MQTSLAVFNSSAVLRAVAKLANAFSFSALAFAPTIKPIIAKAGPATIPPSTIVPPAMPRPPAANEPPPKNARVALVAAAPLRFAISVPVDAAANCPAAPHAPKAVIAPPNVPADTPPKTEVAKFPISLSSANDCLSILNLLSSCNPIEFSISMLRNCSKDLTKRLIPLSRISSFCVPSFSMASRLESLLVFSFHFALLTIELASLLVALAFFKSTPAFMDFLIPKAPVATAAVPNR